MDKYNLLDCTLRDGGYVNDWEFGHNIITEVYKKLDLSGMEYIEVGFLDDRRKFDLNRTIVPNTSCFNILFENVPKKKAVPVAMIDFGHVILVILMIALIHLLMVLELFLKKKRLAKHFLFAMPLRIRDTNCLFRLFLLHRILMMN